PYPIALVSPYSNQEIRKHWKKQTNNKGFDKGIITLVNATILVPPNVFTICSNDFILWFQNPGKKMIL
ncbi:hypothetical protein, partial [Enterococcus faecium]|uniref:hypothetical protein n=1 Tax=Enterococcus faecium TaxID=1352 RepID=UPI003AB0BDB1